MKTRLRSFVERIVSYGLTVVAAAGLIYFLTKVDKRQKETLQKMETALNTHAEEIKQSEEFLQNRRVQIKTIKEELARKSQEIRDRFDQRLSKAENYTLFIEQVQEKAGNLNITINSSQYQPPSTVAGAPASYLEFKFTLDVTGSYGRMKQFLWELENTFGRLVKISRIVIKPPICDETGNMNITMTLSTYFLP